MSASLRRGLSRFLKDLSPSPSPSVSSPSSSSSSSSSAAGDGKMRLGPAVWLGVKVGCLVHVISDYVGSLIMCTGPSMLPTLSAHGDVVVVDRISARFDRLQRGDVVVATSPQNPKTTVCKRIIGLPGDRVCINPTKYPRKFKTVPRNHVYLLGDNLGNSTDSRTYGFVCKALVTGRVVYRVLPFRHAGPVERYYEASEWPVEPEGGVIVLPENVNEDDAPVPAGGVEAPAEGPDLPSMAEKHPAVERLLEEISDADTWLSKEVDRKDSEPFQLRPDEAALATASIARETEATGDARQTVLGSSGAQDPPHSVLYSETSGLCASHTDAIASNHKPHHQREADAHAGATNVSIHESYGDTTANERASAHDEGSIQLPPLDVERMTDT